MNAQERKNLVNELRKAHFSFGNESVKGFSEISDYKNNFIDHNIQNQEKQSNQNIRQTHFIFGSDDNQQFYKSMMKESYKEPMNVENIQLNDNQKKDLRKHHFEIGRILENEKDENNYLSESKINFNQKQFDKSTFQDRSEQVKLLRSHHHEFGDNENYYSSVYIQNHNKNLKDFNSKMQGKSKQEIMNQIVQLRKTNLSLGSSKPQYNSIYRSDFSQQSYNKNKLCDLGLKQTNFIFGTDDQDYQSISKQEHNKKPLSKNFLNVELLKDLRATHFQLGFDKLQYQSENNQQFKQFENQTPATYDIQRFQRKNFNYGFQIDPKEMYVSQYKNDINSVAEGQKDENWIKNRQQNYDLVNKNQKIQSNIDFGVEEINGKIIYQSEAQSEFKNFGIGHAAPMDEQRRKELRKHATILGTDNIYYQTEQQAIFYDKSKQKISSIMDKALKDDLRKNHFIYGNQQVSYEPTSKEIGQKQGPPTLLDPKLAKDLRSHHYIAGDDEVDYKTLYQNQFSKANSIAIKQQ